jgi:UDP-glucose 4-epimerase
MWFYVLPYVFQVDKEEVQDKFIFGCNYFVANSIGIRAYIELFVAGLNISDEALIEGLFTLSS